MTPVFENIRIARRNQHIFFWLAWVVSFTFIKSIGFAMPVYFDWLIYYLVTLPIFIVHTYLIAYWLVPFFFLKRKYFIFCFLFLLLLYGFSIFELLISNELVFRYLSSIISPEEDYLSPKNIIISGIGNHYIIVLFLSVKVLKNWYSVEEDKRKLQMKVIEAEIELLRNQLQPRFLLNVMGFLEKMAEEKSEKTPDMVIRISSLMNSLLIDNSTSKISLRKELNLIESYIDIQKMVQDNGLYTQVIRSGDLESRKIQPLCFFPVVEKLMGLFEKPDSGDDFKIFVKAESNYLLFLVSFYFYKKDPYDLIQDAITKLDRRLSYYYNEDYRLNYMYEKGMTELVIEIFKK